MNSNFAYRYFNFIVVLVSCSFLFTGCGGDIWDIYPDQVQGTIRQTYSGAVSGARVYPIPLLRTNGTPTGVFTDGGGEYHYNGLDSGYWVFAASTGASIAWSQPVYVDYFDEDVVIDITSPFISIESSFSNFVNQGHMVVASNFNHGTSSYPSALNLITTSGWQEFYPVFNPDYFEYGPCDYNLSIPGEVVFAAGYPGNKDVFRFNMLTGEFYNLTNSDNVDESDPAFSPDGQHVVYSADAMVDPYDSAELWVVDRNGQNRQMFLSDEQWVDTNGDTIADSWVYHSFITPRWHSRNLTGTDGGSIVFSFASERDATWSIGVAGYDHPDFFYQLTDNSEFDDVSPQIHPDSNAAGFTIVFSRTAEGIYPGIYETHLYSVYGGNLDGGSPLVSENSIAGLYSAGYSELYPSFSRGGDYLTFVSSDGSTDEVYSCGFQRNYTLPDAANNIYQWTLSSSGTLYKGPRILSRD